MRRVAQLGEQSASRKGVSVCAPLPGSGPTAHGYRPSMGRGFKSRPAASLFPSPRGTVVEPVDTHLAPPWASPSPSLVRPVVSRSGKVIWKVRGEACRFESCPSPRLGFRPMFAPPVQFVCGNGSSAVRAVNHLLASLAPGDGGPKREGYHSGWTGRGFESHPFPSPLLCMKR